MTADQAFDRIYASVYRSAAYRDALEASQSGLPEWVAAFSSLSQTLLDRIERELRLREGQTLVDLACGGGGPGIWLAQHARSSLVGVDFSAHAITSARTRAERRGFQARFHVADLMQTPLECASADAIVCIDALMFVEPQRAIDEMARLAKPGATVVVTAAESLVEPFMPTLVRDYRPFFERAGFTIRSHADSIDSRDQTLRLHRAILERELAFRSELGDDASDVLAEARAGCDRAEQGTERVRQVLIVAERS